VLLGVWKLQDKTVCCCQWGLLPLQACVDSNDGYYMSMRVYEWQEHHPHGTNLRQVWCCCCVVTPSTYLAHIAAARLHRPVT
jgi:hypothetical protein